MDLNGTFGSWKVLLQNILVEGSEGHDGSSGVVRSQKLSVRSQI